LIFAASDFLEFDQLQRIHPLLKPVADTIAGSIDDVIKKRLDAAASGIRKDILKANVRVDWNEPSKMIRSTAAEIVQLRVDESVQNMAGQTAEEIWRRSNRIASLEGELNFEAKMRQVDTRSPYWELAALAAAARSSLYSQKPPKVSGQPSFRPGYTPPPPKPHPRPPPRP
jgi:hypothetical protein